MGHGHTNIHSRDPVKPLTARGIVSNKPNPRDSMLWEFFCSMRIPSPFDRCSQKGQASALGWSEPASCCCASFSSSVWAPQKPNSYTLEKVIRLERDNTIYRELANAAALCFNSLTGKLNCTWRSMTESIPFWPEARKILDINIYSLASCLFPVEECFSKRTYLHRSLYLAFSIFF